jgi:hypothetical protein
VKSNLIKEYIADEIKPCMVFFKYLLNTKIKFHRPILDFLDPVIFKGREE